MAMSNKGTLQERLKPTYTSQSSYRNDSTCHAMINILECLEAGQHLPYSYFLQSGVEHSELVVEFINYCFEAIKQHDMTYMPYMDIHEIREIKRFGRWNSLITADVLFCRMYITWEVESDINTLLELLRERADNGLATVVFLPSCMYELITRVRNQSL